MSPFSDFEIPPTWTPFPERVLFWDELANFSIVEHAQQQCHDWCIINCAKTTSAGPAKRSAGKIR